ncbi:thiamine pyrophosphate-binding protein [bacterium]|nr:thiamine pyrophosphate-binding protein [bacterium]
MIRLADYIFKVLAESGVKDLFMVSGGSAMHLVDAVGKCKKIRFIACHHEQTCAMAAESYAKMTNELGVALVTSGPAATNAVTGVAGAFVDSVPCLIISGQSKRKETVYNANIPGLRQFGVQEMNIIPIVASITKYAVMINDPNRIKYHLEKALYLAKTGRPGPVWLDVPLDIQGQMIDEDQLEGFDPGELTLDYSTEPDPDDIEKVAELLKGAIRPVIVAGHGVRLAGATEELAKLASKFDLPVVTPFMGIDVIDSSNRNYIGRMGTKGTRAGNFAVQNADVLISIGSRLCVSSIGYEYHLFAREAVKVVVDIDPNEHKKETIKIDLFVNADAKIFLRRLLDRLGQTSEIVNRDWLETCDAWKTKYPVCLPEYATAPKGINYYYLVDRVTRKAAAHIPVVSDAGSAFYVVAQAIQLKPKQRFVTSGGLATMGFNLPAAVGVSAAINNSPVIAITGEGSLQMNIQELQTILTNNMPVKIFVVNNKGYFSIRSTQQRFFNDHYVGEGTESGVSFPSLKKISEAYGIIYYKVSESKKLDSVIDTVLAHNGPVICEVMNVEDQQIIPTVSSVVKPNGKMISKPIEDMFPFLEREEFLKNMSVKPVDEDE